MKRRRLLIILAAALGFAAGLASVLRAEGTSAGIPLRISGLASRCPQLPRARPSLPRGTSRSGPMSARAECR